MSRKLIPKELKVLNQFKQLTNSCIEATPTSTLIQNLPHMGSHRLVTNIKKLVKLGYIEAIKPIRKIDPILYKTISDFNLVITRYNEYKSLIELSKAGKKPKSIIVPVEIILPLGARIVNFSGSDKESKRLQELLNERDKISREDLKIKHKKSKRTASSGFSAVSYQIPQ